LENHTCIDFYVECLIVFAKIFHATFFSAGEEEREKVLHLKKENFTCCGAFFSFIVNLNLCPEAHYECSSFCSSLMGGCGGECTI